jgi:hypothetical protein
MRPTLHDYVEYLNEAQRPDVIMEYMANAFQKTLKFAKLTNRAPRLGDFVPCDEEGNVLEKPNSLSYYSDICGYQHGQNKIAQYQSAQDRVIFAGYWEVVYSNEDETCINYDGFSITFTKNYCFCIDIINRIEDLPREIEFKDTYQ